MKKLIPFTLLISFLVACSTATPTPYPTFTPSPMRAVKIEILETTTYRTTIDGIDNLVIDGLIQNMGETSFDPIMDFSVVCKGFYSDGRLADVDERTIKGAHDILEPGEQGIFRSYLDEWKPGQTCCPQIDRYSCEIIFYSW